MATLGSRIGVGRQAEVYAWDEGRVLKLFYPQTRATQVEREASLTKAVVDAGLPVPRVFETVQIGDRHGFVMSRVEGPSMFDQLGARPWALIGSAKLLAKLHAQVNGARSRELPTLRERMAYQIERTPKLTDEWERTALAILESLPDGDSVCHGDFHPDNVMMTADGPVLIDWPGATRGAPEADFARTLLLMSTASLPPHVPLLRRGLVNAVRAMYTRTYRRAYLSLIGVSPEQVQAWMLPVCAARFHEDISEDEPALRRLMTRLIARL